LELRSRIYWDQSRLLDLYSQVRPEPSGQLRFDSLGLKLSAGVLDVKTTIRRSDGEAGWTDILDTVVEALRESCQLGAVRPETCTEYAASEAEFVYEFISATKVILPVDIRLVARGCPSELTVWVADPPPRPTEPKDPWDWWGSYLFLVEEIDPVGPRATHFTSGISALAEVVRFAQPMITDDSLWDLGRDSPAHPIEKLIGFGGRPSLPRRIEVLYQMRYMTNEQGGWSVSEGRVNDLLGYPLAILPSLAAP
jgi:hypothetical protein